MHAVIFDVPGTETKPPPQHIWHLAAPAGRRQLQVGTTAPLHPHGLFPLRPVAAGAPTRIWREEGTQFRRRAGASPVPRPRSTKKQIGSSRRPPIRSIRKPADLLRSTIAATGPARVSFPSNSCRKRAGREQGVGARSARCRPGGSIVLPRFGRPSPICPARHHHSPSPINPNQPIVAV
jgi:hypothetical protein